MKYNIPTYLHKERKRRDFFGKKVFVFHFNTIILSTQGYCPELSMTIMSDYIGQNSGEISGLESTALGFPIQGGLYWASADASSCTGGS